MLPASRNEFSLSLPIAGTGSLARCTPTSGSHEEEGRGEIWGCAKKKTKRRTACFFLTLNDCLFIFWRGDCDCFGVVVVFVEVMFTVNEVCQRVGDVRDGFVVVLVGVTAWRVEICCCCF